MKITENHHIAISVILFMGLLVFVKLGSGEIQPNGEGEYALAAIGDLHQPLETDQQPEISDLSLILIEASFGIFKVTPFYLRLFTALAAIISTMLCWLIARRIASFEISILTVFLVAGSYTWNYFSRIALPEMQIALFILLSLWAIIKLMETEAVWQKSLFAVVFLASFVLAMISKSLMAMLPMLFAAITISTSKSSKDRIILSLTASIGLIAVFLLGLFDLSNYQVSYFHLDFYNQSILPAPMLASIPFLFLLMKNGVFENFENTQKVLLIIIISWAIIGLLLLPFVEAMANYSMFMIAPMAILMIFIINRIRKNDVSLLIRWLFAGIMLLTAYWSFSWKLRHEFFTLFESGDYGWNLIVFALIFKLILLTILFFFLKNKEVLIKNYLKFAVLVVCISMVTKVVFQNFTKAPGQYGGAIECSYALEEFDSDSFVYLYHKHAEGEDYNSQLDWYLDGWMSGKQLAYTYLPYDMPPSGVNLTKLRKLDKLEKMLIIYFRPLDKSIEKSLVEDLEKTRPIVLRTRSYIIFGMFRQGRKGIKEI
jgi:Dolichyl-phosphate-mannose-protein mannosyltransferase